MNQPETRWTHFFWNYWLYRVPKETKTLLDVCAGRGIVGAMSEIYLGIKADGIEIYRPYSKFAAKFYDELWCEDALMKLIDLPDKSYDVVVCFDAIEHFNTIKAFELLHEMERVGRLVFVSSVNWFYRQPNYDGNPYQQHRSLISSRDMEKLGYTTRGFGYRSKFFGSFLFRVPLRHFETGYLAWKICP